MTDALPALRHRLAVLADLRHAGQLLNWDQQTMMPVRGVGARAEALGTLERVGHDLFIAEETGRLLEAAQAQLSGADPDGDEARLVSVTRRRWDKARRIPVDLAADMARAASLGHEAWVDARARGDFDAFAPYLARNIELARRYVECLPEFDSPYDALLDDYEPGLRSAEVTGIFASLKARLMPLIDRLSEQPVDDSCLHQQFPEAAQRRLVDEVLQRMGFEPGGWRLDEAAHPFATGLGVGDVRLTTRWETDYFPGALFGAMHECGHGLYEAGIAPALARTPVGHVESLGLHESQSRLWENMVGRSHAFCTVLAPRITELTGHPLDADTLFVAVNRVKPSCIRIEADETTYGLHIILRFELEQALIEGRLTVADLPEAWNERFREYLGLEVANPAEGVLQDVHWAAGLIGYFPTYALGNLVAGHLWQRAHDDLPDLDDQLAAGELGGLREWLREHVHRHGAKFTLPELLRRITGEPLSVDPFVTYLTDKLSHVYGTALSA